MADIMRSLRAAWAVLAIGLAATVGAAAPPDESPDDQGVYRIYFRDQIVGTEEFWFDFAGDSVVVTSGIVRFPPPGSTEDTLHKSIVLQASALDFDMHQYTSKQQVGPDKLTRGLVVNDTAMTVYREINGFGDGNRVVRPPGRLFVIDTQSFVVFDVMCRMLHGRSFDKRPLVTWVLSEPDTTVELTATNLGYETIRWGSRPVQARKLEFSDPFGNRLIAWASPIGRMLRLQHDALSLRIERVAPAAKRPSPKPKNG